jgi:hypothetical protein
LQTVDAPIGRVWSLSIRNAEDVVNPGSGLIIVPDKELLAKLRHEVIPYRNFTIVVNEKLRAKLRSVRGQFIHDRLPVFYYEYYGLPADYCTNTEHGAPHD